MRPGRSENRPRNTATMITFCEECGKQYKIDPAQIAGAEAQFACKTCGYLITVAKPTPIKTENNNPPAAPNSAGPKAQNSAEVKPVTALAATQKTDTKEKTPPAKKLSKMHLGLTVKLFVMMIIVSLVPLAMFWGVSLKQTKSRMQNETQKYLNHVSISIAGHVEEWIDKNAVIIKTLANMEDIIAMVRLKQEPILKTIPKVYPWIDHAFIIDGDGNRIAGNGDQPPNNYTNRPYFQEAMEGKAITWQTMVDESSKMPVLILAAPIMQHDEIVGVIANVIRLEDLSKRMVTWGGDSSEVAFIVDEKGRVIAHKDTRYIAQHKNLSRHPLIAAFKKGHRGLVSFAQDGKSIIGRARGTALGWIVAIQQEEKEAFYFIDQLMSYAYLLLAVTVVFVFIIAWFSGRALSRPIVKLTDAANRISVGELDVKINTQRKDEIGDLAVAITRLQDSIRLSIEKLRQRR